MKADKIIIDVKTGKQTREEFDFEEIPTEPPEKSINQKKLKQLLKDKGIIADFGEVE